MSIRVLIPAVFAPVDATHYLPDSRANFECWVKAGHSMRVHDQTEWVEDKEVDADIKNGIALEIV